MKIGKHQKLLMIGDSITDAGRARPVGEGMGEAIGKGYVAQVDALIGARYPDLGIRIVNMGSSGNTVRDLKNRWETDVVNLMPDWVSIMIGTNDVWRQFDRPRQTEIHVLPAEYEETLDQLVAKTKKQLKGMVLMTPFFMEPLQSDAMRVQMDRYGAIVKKIATKHKTLFVDTQEAFNEVLKHYYSATIGWDRVHPNHVGHMVLARAFLKSIEFEW